MLTDEELGQIAARSLSLYERLDEPRARIPIPEEAFRRKLDTWRERVAEGNDELFCRRIRAERLEPGDLSAIISDPVFVDLQLPEWCLFLKDALSSVSQWTQTDIFGLSGHTADLPFYPLARPFLRAAQRRLTAVISSAPLLNVSAIDQALDYLARSLCTKAASTYHLEFVIFRASHENSLNRALRQARGEQSDRLYRQFVRSFYDGKWHSFFLEYAVLARQLSIIALQWIEAVSVLTSRLYSDLASIESRFQTKCYPGPVTALKLGLSDSHNGGHTTALITFQSGFRLIYKPKPLGTDGLVAELLQWLNSKPGVLRMANPVTLDCATHGWQQLIEYAACKSEAEVRSFYVRVGQLLGVTYALEAYDYHHENLIAHGDQPYLVDTETIFNPYKELEAISSQSADAAALASATIYYSVLRTGLLPNWRLTERGSKRDTSGLGGSTVDGNDPDRVSVWRGVNSDDMRHEFVERPVPVLSNQPFIEGRPAISASEYVPEIRDGFARVYRTFVANRTELQRLLEKWPATQVRFVRRPTNLYALLLRRLLRPEYLRNGMDWSIQLDIQSRQLLSAKTDDPEIWGLLREESATLMDGDIPYFKVRSDSCDIFNGKGQPVVRDYLDVTCAARLRRKLEMLNSRDQNLQDRYIVYTFYARAARNLHEGGAPSEPVLTRSSTRHLSPVSSESLKSIAFGIAEELMEEAVHSDDGSVSWIALEYLQQAGVFQFKPISFNLYSGALGVAYFLAALAHISGTRKHRQYALAALAPVLRIAQQEAREVLRFSGLGAGVGLGSLIYGLASIAALLGASKDSDACLEAARNCILHITESILEADSKPDLMFGTAGGILGLAKLRKVAGYPELDDKLIEMGDSLLTKRQETNSNRFVVPTYMGKASTGFSHGVAGIALALARVYETTKEHRFRQAALDHVAFEESLYDSVRGIYPDYRSRDGITAYMTNWCHGAPGIGLSRLLIYDITHDDSLVPQIEKNMAATSRFSLESLDHLCCGTFGRLDIQLEYAVRMESSILDSVRRDAAFVMQRYYANRNFRLFADTPSKVFCPGLFAGAAGIGYALLRLSSPAALRCLLAFE